MDGFSPVKGKCQFWREAPNADDIFDTRLKTEDRRVVCTCFVEGDMWVEKAKDVPNDCPKRYHCRYYIKTG